MAFILEMAKFSEEEIARMREILSEKLESDGQLIGSHVEHSLWQLIRFANLSAKGHEFRALQFGLNLGRAQELLRSYGGVNAWWRTFEPLVKEEKWFEIIAVTKSYLETLKLTFPDDAFINRL